MLVCVAIWCGFLVGGAIAAGTALWASGVIWSFYTRIISYLLMGTLSGIEMLFRFRFKRLLHLTGSELNLTYEVADDLKYETRSIRYFSLAGQHSGGNILFSEGVIADADARKKAAR